MIPRSLENSAQPRCCTSLDCRDTQQIAICKIMDDIKLMSCLPISDLHFFDLCHESILLCIGQAFQAFDRVVHGRLVSADGRNVSLASLELAGEEQRL